MPRNRSLVPALSLLTLTLTAPVALTAHAAPATSQNASAAAPTLTPTELYAALSDPAQNNDALAARIRAAYGADRLTKGVGPKVEDRPGVYALAWAIEAPGLRPEQYPTIESEDETFSLRLRRVGNSDIYVGVAYRPEGLAAQWYFDVNGTHVGGGQFEQYPKPREEYPIPGVPKGKLTQMPAFESKIFAGTTRDWWVYVPAQYSPNNPPAVMVFQDGGDPKNWMPAEFDNMIAHGEIPPTVGIFINPGKFIEGGRSDRSVEYDTLSDAYARFILEEILPEVEKTTKLTHDPEKRVIAGASSGGICAFTVAWDRPDDFRKVITGVGSFTNLQGGPTGVAGGNTYPAIIRKWKSWDGKGQPKPIRIYMSDGLHDIDNAAGSWPLANMQMDRALTFGGYDHILVEGNGWHGGKYFRFKMPEALRWIWRSDSATAPVVSSPTAAK